MIIAIEGIHSAGKSTLVEALAGALRSRSIEVVKTAWNSAPEIGPAITAMKMADVLPPIPMVLLEAADLLLRLERDVLTAPPGAIVLSDRYVATGVARGVLRGLDQEWVESLFRAAPQPDVAVWVHCDPPTTLERRRAAGLRIDGHLAGHDYRPAGDTSADFLVEQQRLAEAILACLPLDRIVVDPASPAGVAGAVELVLDQALSRTPSGPHPAPGPTVRSN